MASPISSFVFTLPAVALLLAAAVSDLRRFTIPNPIVLGLVVVFVIRFCVLSSTGSAIAPLALPVLPALAVLLAGAFAFHRGWLGGGDVKLLAATGLLIPASRALDFLMLVAILGGVLAVAALALARMARPAATGDAEGRSSAGIRLPYGVAISGAGMLILFDPLTP
ncbi:prepilin peptidase [Thalassobaculum sp.]|uniref:A24 family peptidase n=1 Tax=Thalassobaculum sp. TaxID=2022740 RepID=UPI0032EE82B0